MPNSSADILLDALRRNGDDFIRDEWFDQIYPPHIGDLSGLHWTPAAVARCAAKWLVDRAGTKVLDIGAGVGKFCIVGAITSDGHFTGVEQRQHLVEIAKTALAEHEIRNVRMLYATSTSIDFRYYDAFYLFNPFEENLTRSRRIDSTVELTAVLYRRYTAHVASQLAAAPLGTRVATYCGVCEEIPTCYSCEESAFEGTLKLWRKVRHPLKASPVRREPQPVKAHHILEWLWPTGTPQASTR